MPESDLKLISGSRIVQERFVVVRDVPDYNQWWFQCLFKVMAVRRRPFESIQESDVRLRSLPGLFKRCLWKLKELFQWRFQSLFSGTVWLRSHSESVPEIYLKLRSVSRIAQEMVVVRDIPDYNQWRFQGFFKGMPFQIYSRMWLKTEDYSRFV